MHMHMPLEQDMHMHILFQSECGALCGHIYNKLARVCTGRKIVIVTFIYSK